MTTAILSIGVIETLLGMGLDVDVVTAAALGVRVLPVVAVVGGGRASRRSYELPVTVVRDQIADCMAEGPVGAIKVGLLRSPAMVNAVADAIEDLAPGVPLVLDVVMIGRDGQSMVDEGTLRHVKIRLLPLTTVLIANLREGELLAGMALHEAAQRPHGAAMMMTLGAKSVLLTGGNPDEYTRNDLFVSEDETRVLSAIRPPDEPRANAVASLSTAVACGIAAGMSLAQAVSRAHDHAQAVIAGRASPLEGALSA